jgi:hypothetical protein
MLRYSFLLGLENWETAATCVCLHKGSDVNLAAVLVERMSCLTVLIRHGLCYERPKLCLDETGAAQRPVFPQHAHRRSFDRGTTLQTLPI